LAVGTAICIALGGMLASELRGRVDLLRLVRWQFVSAFMMSGLATFALGDWSSLTRTQFILLVLSGLSGVVFAGITYFGAIYRAGPRITALLFSLTSPFSLLFGYVILGEVITLRQGAGVLLVLGGIVLAIGREREPSRRGPLPWVGIGLGVLAALGQSLGTLAARPAMASGAEPLAAMAVRAGTAAVFFSALLLVPLRQLHKPYGFKPRELGLAVGSAFFGSVLGMLLLMNALRTGNVGIVATLSSMTPVVILPMVWIRNGAPPPRRAWLGAAAAVTGVAVISL